MSTPTDQQQQQWTQTTKNVPAAALVFNLGVFQFAEDVSTGGGADGKNVAVKLLARTGQPIKHWYWGNVVHDLAGMKLHKDTLPIDYCHEADEVIGYLDKFDTTSGDLVATGALVPFAAEDRAQEVAFKSKNKVPYEASINFNGGPLRLEELEQGTSAAVNGQVVQGPALIIREWTLRGVAICPYGADMNTKTEFARANSAKDDGTIDVTIFKSAGGSMSQPNKSTDAGATAGAGTIEKKPADPAQLQQTAAAAAGDGAKPGEKPAVKPGDEFVAAFGDVGARWYLEGKPFATAAAEFIGTQKTRVTELEAKVKELTDQMAAMPRGNEAVTFQSEKKDKSPRAAEFEQKLGPNMGKFAAGIKLPGDAAGAAGEKK